MAIKPIKYTRSLGKIVASEARGIEGIYHVIPTNARWAIVPDGKVRAVRIFDSRSAALTFAKKVATKKNGTVVVHNNQGKVQSRYSYI